MTMVDTDKDFWLRSERIRDVASTPQYPEDQIDFGYEIVASRHNDGRQSRGPDGLSLVARVYE